MCHYETSIWSEPTESDKLDINTAAVSATITAGIGYSTLHEMCAGMNISCMSEVTYIKYREKVFENFQETALENMKKAGEIEKQLAIENNEVIDGKGLIAVVADGSWNKRSYGKGYDSLSGVGTILGYRTRKVLYMGVFNKYCSQCDYDERNGCEPKIHKCFKNFDRNISSTRMESDAIAQGFNCSIEMHGLVYKTLIADGDSSVYKSIRDNDPYRKLMITVEKIECNNHMFRNFDKKMDIVSAMTQSKTKKRPGFIETRKIVKKYKQKIREEVMQAASLQREKDRPQHEKVRELRFDILNIPSHVYGEHKRCKERGRECKIDRETEINYVPHLKLHGFYQKIMDAIKYLSIHADSLLQNVTNNPAEAYHSNICKVLGGKRIFFGARGSYNARIAGSVLQHNTQQVLIELHQGMDKTVPVMVEKLEKQRQIKVTRTRESRKTDGRKRKWKQESKTDCHYGPQSQKPDLPDDVFEQFREKHIEKLTENAKKWKQIERDTIEQSESEIWLALRREMLTASNFGIVCRMRPTTSCALTVKNILYPSVVDTAGMKYGRENEKEAIKVLATKLNKDIQPCGLFIDYKNPCLGASPDGLIEENGLVEIKCPLSAEQLTAEEAIKTLPALKGIFAKKNQEEINRNHRFYYQIQGQLNITRREYCILAIWTPKSIKLVHVNRDATFWSNKMLPALLRFYNECMLPEILDSRHNRHMPIRNPTYILEAQAEAAKKIHIRTENIPQNTIQNEDILKEKKIKRDFSSTEKSNNAAVNIEDDDCVIVSFTKEMQNKTDKQMASVKKYLDEEIPLISDIKKNVLPINSRLDDVSLAQFLRVVRETSQFETQNVLYIAFPDMIEASQSNKSLQIIGGNCSDHWRCIFFDGNKLHVYDSLPNCTYERLVAEEKNYIHRRYPKISQNDIIYEKVQTQPDGTSCGIYAAAFATTVALGDSPCNKKYSKDVKCMRQHFIRIIENNKLMPFPSI
ncbi:uncharacterized protein LOC118648181 isoform X2 [Monomorium pharaonis]|nr:uncharacterized protein LOC118648181 isoform X2 [Monomorium pharaonis]